MALIWMLTVLSFGAVLAHDVLVQEWNIDQSLPRTSWKGPRNGKNPGLMARITTHGLNYATRKAIEDLSSSLTGMAIPGQSGKSGDVEYSVSNMVIKEFNKPSSEIVLRPKAGLEWTANGMGMSASGDWRYKYKKGWFKVSDHGSFDIKISGVNFHLGINIGMDNTGRPNIRSDSCNDQIGGVSVKFHGGASWIYNLFKGKIADMIKDKMDGQICTVLNKVINDNAERALSDLKVQVDIAHKLLLDYSFIAKPVFTTNFMDTIHKGEVTWKGSNSSTPFSAPPLSPSSDTSRMFYIWISDFVYNSMTYAAHVNGFLKYNMTKKDLPPDQQQALNTTCTDSFCIGNFIAELKRSYPNSSVQLRLSTTSAPFMNISSKAISVQNYGTIVFDIQLPNNSYVYSAITLNADIAINFVIKSAVGKFVRPTLDSE
ncbi:hypothetical protein FSP39_004971 [Pinctada imbricata]|uniref:Lipid-binding serum glycoprotein N-terminal domain-containing protein n=1 Tax=Pinctada imbricata TaxID=66713 RepID=A0AA88XQE7_PINIB|nr:hypothetical protein FSP39_004971 [Pinctada imbricata]